MRLTLQKQNKINGRQDITHVLAIVAMLTTSMVVPDIATAQSTRSDFFIADHCEKFSSTGRYPFLILEPGHKLVLAGEKNGKQLRKSITVLSQTRVVDGVETRVVLERETIDGEIFELSRNYFANCNRDNSVFYFGEDVDFFVDRLIIGHDGSWRAGVRGAKAGVVMSGIVPETVLLGAKYFQELAPAIALDRARVLSVDATVYTPAGRFTNVLQTRETTIL